MSYLSLVIPVQLLMVVVLGKGYQLHLLLHWQFYNSPHHWI